MVNNSSGTNTSGNLFQTSLTADGVLYADSSGVLNSTAAGTSGQILQSKGAGVAPAYTTATFPSTAGTSGTLLQSNGTNIVNTTATYPGTATGTGTILRADGTNWAATTATYPATTTINRILYSSANSTISEIPTANSGVLVTSASGVPSINATVTSWTPTVNFGGATTGIMYAAQAGGYYQIGQAFFFDVVIVLSSKGSATGVATITGLPAITAPRSGFFVIDASFLTFTGQVVGRIGGSSEIILEAFASGGARAQLDDTSFANNTLIEISGTVLLS